MYQSLGQRPRFVKKTIGVSCKEAVDFNAFVLVFLVLIYALGWMLICGSYYSLFSFFVVVRLRYWKLRLYLSLFFLQYSVGV